MRSEPRPVRLSAASTGWREAGRCGAGKMAMSGAIALTLKRPQHLLAWSPSSFLPSE